jgi:hypothetical protein
MQLSLRVNPHSDGNATSGQAVALACRYEAGQFANPQTTKIELVINLKTAKGKVIRGLRG